MTSFVVFGAAPAVFVSFRFCDLLISGHNLSIQIFDASDDGVRGFYSVRLYHGTGMGRFYFMSFFSC